MGDKDRKLSLTASNQKELISIVISGSSRKVTIIRQSSGQISRDIYRLENIKAD